MMFRTEAVSMKFRTRAGVIEALESVSLEVEDGEFMVLVGPSGCGKSTLLKLAAGLLTPTSGRVLLREEVVLAPRTSEIGVMFQSPVLLPWKSVLDNVMLQATLRRLPRKTYESRSRDLLKRVGLAGYEDKYVFELSGGMQQRTSFCRAMLHEPNLLLMDEPFGALDALTREQIMFDLQKTWLEAGGQTVLFVTHNINEAVFMGDRVAVFSNAPGQILDVIPIELPRPRTRSMMEAEEVRALESRIRSLVGVTY
jgi:NitT/TauT family transport system ATP-binding protein